MKTRLPRIPRLLSFLLVSCLPHFVSDAAAIAADAPVSAGVRSSLPSGSDVALQTDSLLDRAIGLLEAYHSVSASVSYEADLFDRQFLGNGDYREERSGPVPKVRLEVRMPQGNETGAMVEVCDGHRLWSYFRLADDEKLTQIDLNRVAQAIGEPVDATLATPMTGTIALGGLAGLVRELKRNFRFDSIRTTQFRDQPAWELRGRWRPSRLAAILPDQKDAILRGDPPDLAGLPPQLPSHVCLTLGRDNLLPYQVEYWRIAPQASHGRPPTPASLTQTRLVLRLRWFEINLNEPMKPSDFEYRPGDIKVFDATNNLIDRLKARSKSSD